MLLEDLIITDTSKENVFELQENYPCCSRDMVITAGNSRVVPWHWHEELEILYVREGEIDYWTAGNCIRLRKSDGIFINTNVMHQVSFSAGNGGCQKPGLYVPTGISGRRGEPFT